MGSPTSRSLEHARAQGWLPWVVERHNTFTRRKTDLFGLFDIVIVTGSETIAVQACAGASHAARRAKMLGQPQEKDETAEQGELRRARLGLVIASGWRAEIWSWAKRGPRGKRRVWTLRAESLTEADVRAAAKVQP